MEPPLSRRRKISEKVLQDYSNSCCHEVYDIEISYQQIYFNALDTVINAINEQFDQPGYTSYENIERLFLSAFNHKYLEPWINEVMETCNCDVRRYKLEIQFSFTAIHESQNCKRRRRAFI